MMLLFFFCPLSLFLSHSRSSFQLSRSMYIFFFPFEFKVASFCSLRINHHNKNNSKKKKKN